jgi:dienelactone hydrolase
MFAAYTTLLLALCCWPIKLRKIFILKSQKMKPVLFFAILLFSLQSFSQVRYVSRVFEETQKISNVTYSNADSWDALYNGVNFPQDIKLDVYMPVEAGDNLRPTVICLFGGAFLAGSKDMRPDILAWCDSLSHFGYVAIAIDYRIGFNPATTGGGLGPAHGMKRAAWRAIQDCNSAIDFIKENFETYRIDTTQIFLLGNSAGSITAINTVFLDDSERYEETYDVGTGANNDDLGDLNSKSLFPEHTNEVAGVVGLWGATMDFNWFDEGEQVPMLFIHGDEDEIVPHDEGMAFNFGDGTDINIYLYGSLKMHEYFDLQGWENEFHLYPGQPHAFYSCGEMDPIKLERENFPCENWEPVFNQVIGWLSLYNTYYQTSDLAIANKNVNLSLFPNPAKNSVSIESQKILGNVKIADAFGRVVYENDCAEKTLNINLEDIAKGFYVVIINDKAMNKLIVCD